VHIVFNIFATITVWEAAQMRHVLWALAIVGVSASSVFAVAWPAPPDLHGGPKFLGTDRGTITYSPTQVTLAQTNYPSIPAALAWFDPSATYGNDYSVWATIRFDQTKKTELGVCARANPDKNQLYMFSLNPISGYLALTSASALVPSNLATYPLGGAFDITKDYKVFLSVKGTQLDGWLYSDTGTLIRHLEANDSNWATGWTGGYAFAPSGASGVFGTFIDHGFGPPVPEPGIISMMIAGALALLGWAGLRRRRG
jgi:hypothetical protein